MGMSPRQYLSKRKLEEAQLLLTSQKYSIAEVGEPIGYESAAAFYARVLQALRNIPPIRAKKFLKPAK